MDELAIWWVTPGNEMHLQHRVEEVDALPSYISVEVHSLFGRALRGRLWVSAEIQTRVEEIPWDASKPCARRASESGGIVVYRKDLNTLTGMPGFVTDMNLNLIKELN